MGSITLYAGDPPGGMQGLAHRPVPAASDLVQGPLRRRRL